MESIGEPIINEKIKELLKIFEPNEDGKKIKKLQIIDGKFVVDYEEENN